jgi:hypothetical protein
MMSVASAADFPMKAKAPAVQYVKVCSLYGAGFYYIPGTDTCLKIGGYIRTQVESESAGGGVLTGTSQSSQGLQDRVDSNDIQYRNRAVVTFDTRTQGEYGTLRSYYRVGWEQTTPGGSAAGTGANAYWDRAFIQFAGFTVGKAQSFFDIYTPGGARNYINVRTSGDTGAAGLMLWAYTAQFGNGFSATLSLEDPKGHNMAGTFDVSGAGFIGVLDNGLTNNTGGSGFQVPDIVGNLRIDQPWGYFGVSAALHQVAGGYFLTPDNVANGHPSDEWGYAFGVGGQLNVPGMPGDTTGIMFTYAHGAIGYVQDGNALLFVDGNNVSIAAGADAVFNSPGTPGGGVLQLVDAWAVNGHYEHAWTRELKTSVYAGYTQINFSGGAKTVLCGGACAPGISPDWNLMMIGSRTQWSPWKGQLNIGVDVVYGKFGTAHPFSPVAPGGAQNLKVVSDTDNVSVMLRVQRNWFP